MTQVGDDSLAICGEAETEAEGASPTSQTPWKAEAGGSDPRQVRWNLGVLTLDVTFFALGMSFMDLSAIVPLLLERLGATGPLIGAFMAARYLAFNLPQILGAYVAHGLPRQKPPLVWAATVTRLPLLALPWLLWHAADSSAARTLALWASLVLIVFWAFGDGAGYVPWMEIVARSFSARIRGRFFATTQFLSGVISIGAAALVVRPVLQAVSLPYPHDYALLLGLAALMFQISLVGVLLIREPRVPALPSSQTVRPPLAAYFRRLPGLVRSHPVFARLAWAQLLLGAGSAATPFYVLYATRHFNLSDSWGGTYQMMQAIGVVTLTPLWAFLSERRSPATAVRALALACLLTPVLALTAGAHSPWLFGLVFLLMGGSLGWGMWIVFNHFLLEHIAEEERPVFVALLNLLYAPSAIYPFLGGLLVPHKQLLAVAGMPLLFLLTALVTALGAALTLRLPAPDV
ncbi:MAG TPA: MFS transporter [Chthonomonadaceae bacterium]|nr:MFS transporter [Chthonomonadaceae bacterium]